MADRLVQLVEQVTDSREGPESRHPAPVALCVGEADASRRPSGWRRRTNSNISASCSHRCIGSGGTPRRWPCSTLDSPGASLAGHLSYEAMGDRIHWAVLDSGCTAHPHFDTLRNIAARWDCTKLSDGPLKRRENAHDEVGDSHRPFRPRHTRRRHHRRRLRLSRNTAAAPDLRHRAGSQASHLQGAGRQGPRRRRVDHQGAGSHRLDQREGRGAEHRRREPEPGRRIRTGRLRLRAYAALRRAQAALAAGCGRRDCRRQRRFPAADLRRGDVQGDVPCSIGDPANLEEAIAVGAVHKEKPHTYGMSHFSSRGPTADGRNKPDCVAPGEQILSRRHDPKATKDPTQEICITSSMARAWRRRWCRAYRLFPVAPP